MGALLKSTLLIVTAMSVIMRPSFLLVCIGVQIIGHGVSSLLASVPGIAR
jgi:multisubunit Na+/H+ antiporter MnhC subunit